MGIGGQSSTVAWQVVKMGLRRRPYAFTEQGVAMLSSEGSSEGSGTEGSGTGRCEKIKLPQNPVRQTKDLARRKKAERQLIHSFLSAISPICPDLPISPDLPPISRSTMTMEHECYIWYLNFIRFHIL